MSAKRDTLGGGRPEVVGRQVGKGRVKSADSSNAHAVGEVCCRVGVVCRRSSFIQRVSCNAPRNQRVTICAVAHPRHNHAVVIAGHHRQVALRTTSIIIASNATIKCRTRLQRCGAQWLHRVALGNHVVTAKVAKHERVAAVEQAEAKAATTAGPSGRCRDRPPLRTVVRGRAAFEPEP